MNFGFSVLPTWFILFILIATIWTLIWKGIALWYSARKHKTWFIVILIFNTLGILPIIYLAIHKWCKKKKKSGK